jgi:hypothetical protein
MARFHLNTGGFAGRARFDGESGADRRARQAETEAEFIADQNARPNLPPTPVEKCCPANLGKAHDYTMKGVDGKRRCWFCCALPPAVTA